MGKKERRAKLVKKLRKEGKIGPMNYDERLALLNKEDDSKTVFDSIDRPIRDLVLIMNSIGLITKFSCCGFTYPNEEEPKSHAIHPFVQFYAPDLNQKQQLENFFRFVGALPHPWHLEVIGPGLFVVQAMTPKEDQWRGTPQNPSIHDYEVPAIAIHTLIKHILNKS